MAVSDHQLGHGLQPLGRLLAHRLVQFPVPPLALAAAIGDHWQIDSRALSTDSLFVEELNCVWPNVNKTNPSAVRIQMLDQNNKLA